MKAEYDRQIAAETPEAFIAPTTADCISRYLVDAQHRRVHGSQIRMLRRWLRDPLSGLLPRELGGRLLRDWRTQRALEAAPSTVQREIGALIAALNWAAHPDKGGMIATGDVPKVALGVVHYPEKGWLDEEAEAEFHARALAYQPRGKWNGKSKVGLFVAIGLGTGARKEAIETVPWSRIDMKARRIDFRDPTRPVNNKRRVLTVIDPRLFNVLDTVPLSERWGPVIGVDITKAFMNFVKTTPWPWITAHTMRCG